MPKAQTQYVCQSCGAVHPRWSGRCAECGEWNTLEQEQAVSAAPKGLGRKKGTVLEFTSLAAAIEQHLRQSTGIGELDRVLGGGLVEGAAVLIGGDPGIGKSTLLLQVAARLAQSGESVAYFTGEESVAQVQLRAQRLSLTTASPLGGGNIMLTSATSVRDILASMEGKDKPSVAIIDSIQTMYLDTMDAAPGTVGQVRASASELIRAGKQRGIAMLLVGHVTKDGQIAGPRVLEHMVDCVLYFEGERGHDYRILRTVKNRFGATDEIGVFSMAADGLQEVSNPSALFLGERDNPVSGAAVLAGMEGTRPVLVELQALVAPSGLATPRRAVVGWDSARLAMVLAVLEARGGMRFADKEVYLNVAGGLRIHEPAADLAAAAALVSALSNKALPADAVFFGEIGLSGEIRPVARQELRLREAAKLGFKRAYIPARSGQAKGESGLVIHPLDHVEGVATLL